MYVPHQLHILVDLHLLLLPATFALFTEYFQ
jgi:hypothetical protein